MFLAELDKPVTTLKGIGGARAAELARAGIHTQRDLLLHFPRNYEDRKTPVSLAEGVTGRTVNTVVRVTGQEWIGWKRKKVLKVYISDGSADAALVCYGRNFLEKILKTDDEFRIYGHFQLRFSELQSSSFDTEPVVAPGSPLWSSGFGLFLPVYPLTGSMTQKQLRSAIGQALKEGGAYIENEMESSLYFRFGVESRAAALRSVHFPSSPEDAQKARDCLAFEELFYLHLNIARRGSRSKTSAGRKKLPRVSEVTAGHTESRVLHSLPFCLTGDQQRVLEEIRTDICSDHPMSRLLQGDVGSGKTLIAFLSALCALETGRQTAFMAPTELLARQHADNAARMLEFAGIRVALLTGSTDRESRALLLKSLKEGKTDILIGTHALFSGDVVYNRLGLVIIDEQHRFGVGQRIALAEKSREPVDFLLMTATPIPRTLAQTLFSDLDVSVIAELPPGRKPVHTHLARMGNEEKVYRHIENELANGRQAYFVYPLIDESETLRLKDAGGMFEKLKDRYPGKTVGLIHSRLKENEKIQIMQSFAAGNIQVLVATSVVEVGVDIPNASCMIIEHAERFGLAALHQLRGRVGRGQHQSYCFLVYSKELTPEGVSRLKVMKETNDGFEIAEQDLILRGPGDLSGTRQSGFLDLRFADLIRDRELSDTARAYAREITGKDPGLLLPEHAVYRKVLHKANPFDPARLMGI